MLSITILIFMFFLIYFFHINVFNWFNIAGIKPNLFIVLILCIGLFIGKNVAIPFGFICGIYLDVLTGKQIGISSLMYASLGFLGGYFDKNFCWHNSPLNVWFQVVQLYMKSLYTYII